MRFAKSGLSAAEFCRKYGVQLTTFSTWRRRERREGKSAPERSGFARVCVTGPISTPSGPVVIELPNALRLEVPMGIDPGWVSQLVGSLIGS
jgi:transposase-like protein